MMSTSAQNITKYMFCKFGFLITDVLGRNSDSANMVYIYKEMKPKKKLKLKL